MKALLVVDMQEDYIGKEAKYNFNNKEKLICNINENIRTNFNSKNYIVYVKNRGKKDPSNFVSGLDILTEFIFEKEKSSCFSNPKFKEFLDKNNIDEIEICGIDGNCCVKNTAIDAVKCGYKVSLILSNVGVINKDRFDKTLSLLKKSDVNLLN